MKLWLLVLWPKPKARQYTQYNNDRDINLQFETRTYSIPSAAATRTTTFLSTFVISALLLITTTWGLTVTQQQTGNYEAVSANADAEVVSDLTELTNSYASPNYIKNYYQVGEPDSAKQQQQHENGVVSAAMNLAYQQEVGEAGVIGRGFVGLQPSNYRNAVIARGTSFGVGRAAGGVGGGDEPLHAYDGGFMPTTFTAAGQHYAASLDGVQTATDKINALHQYATSAANKNSLQTNSPPYGNVNSNNNNNVAEVDNNKAQHSLFRRLSNYGGLDNIGNGEAGDGADSSGETSGTNLAMADDNSDGEAVGGTSTTEFMQNYALAYADNGQQSSLLQNFYNQQAPYNDGQSVPEQTFANYFPQSMAAATAAYEIANQQKYYTLNNYEQTAKPQQHQHQQQLHQYEQQQYGQTFKQQPNPYELQQQQQTFNKVDILPDTPAPTTYYQTYIQHKNDNKEQHHHQHRHVAADNYNRWKQNQITANYQPKQSAIEKQQQQQQQQIYPNNQYHQHHHLIQEPETAETSRNARFKKSPKHKSKRHDNPDALHEHTYNYDTLLEQNDNTIEHVTDDFSHVQIQQLEKLQEQLQLQQQQFIELQHQLIDHDQQLQIQKHIANAPAPAPALPPITQTVHHTPHSLQALAGSPLSKHTHVIRAIPVPQVRQVHVPYRENVTIEVPDPVIASIKKPFAIQIPVTKTVTIPKVQEVKIPIEKLRPFPVERPIPYIVERRVPYTVEKQVAKPVYYPVPIKVPILHTVIHKIHKPPHQQPSFHLPHTVYKKTHVHGNGNGHHSYGYGHGHSHYYSK